MKSYIIINGNNSYEDLELLLKNITIPSSNEEVEEIKVDGRNGSLIVKSGNYPDKRITLNFDLNRKRNESYSEFINRTEHIGEMLDAKKGELILFNRPNKIFNIKNSTKDIKIEHDVIADIEINLICEPFMYLQDEQAITLINPNSKIIYSGTVPGECNIKIYGSGNIQLTINSEIIQINNVNEYVELDSKLLLCLNSDKTSKTRDMIGHFPLLTSGENNISWTGNVSKIEILPRTAYK